MWRTARRPPPAAQWRRCAWSTTPGALELCLPDTLRAAVAQAGPSLRRHGFAVVDGALGETWCHLLRDDIITLTELRALNRNATGAMALTLVRPCCRGTMRTRCIVISANTGRGSVRHWGPPPLAILEPTLSS